MSYFSGQGKIYLGKRDDQGNPLSLRFIGNVPDFKVSLSTEELEHKEATSGQRLTDLKLVVGKSSEVSMSVEEFVAENLEMLFWGQKLAIAAGSVIDELLPNPVTAGGLCLLKNANVSNVTITDSSATPKVLPAAQYSVNAPYGSLSITDATTGGPYVEPFKVDYDFGVATRVGMFTQPQAEYWLRFEGVNTADANRPVMLDIYRLTLSPIKDLALILSGNELAKFEMSGAALMDQTRVSDQVMGQFGRITLI